jgi:Lipoxygenase
MSASVDRADELKLDPSDDEVYSIPLRHSDVHTRVMVKLVHDRVTAWNLAPPGPTAAAVPKPRAALEKMDVLPGILAVPTIDEDGQRFALGQKAALRVTRSLPLTDDADPWPSTAGIARAVKRFASVLPPIDVSWSDPTSDRAIELLALQGLGSHRLESIDGDGRGAAFVVDLTWMHGLPVRPGLDRYGACAYFSAEGNLLRIYTSHDDRDHSPGDPAWDDAKWRWRTSLLTSVTIADHLGATHYLVSNLMTTATREQLPDDHPLRRLLKPFEFRANDVNLDAAMALSPEGGLAHRTFGFTYAGLTRCLLRGIETTSFVTFPQMIERKRVAALGDKFPYATDGLALFAVMHAYAKEYVEIFYPGEEVVHDPPVRAWWQALTDLAPSIALGPLTATGQLIDLLAQFMFTVTGMHSQVGNVVGYLVDPSFMGSKIRAGVQGSDVQSTVQLLNLAALTGLQAPSLLGNFTHLLLDREKDRTLAASARFHDALVALSGEIGKRNQRREQPFETFNPTLLESSVSV